MNRRVAAAAAGVGAFGYSYYVVHHKRSNIQFEGWEQTGTNNLLAKPRALYPWPKAEADASSNWVKCDDGTSFNLYSPPDRSEMKKKMKTEEYDLLVIGGGATGSGVANDAALRGLKVAMIEMDDFASGTSSKSTKLIHGGIRYLALAFQKKIPPKSPLDVLMNLHYDHSMMQVVSHDLYERAFMIQSAPFMTTPLPMMIPLKHYWEIPMMWISGKMYDFIAGSRRAVPESHFISRSEAIYQFPTINPDGLKGAIVLYDGQQNDTRMNLYIALTAAQNGCDMLNHTEVLGLTTKGKLGEESYKITGAKVKDRFTGEAFEIKAKQTINATGPFADTVRKMADPGVSEIIVPAKGSHLIMPDHFSPDHMGMVWFTQDGRVLYLLPWEGSTIAGTTDIKETLSTQPHCTIKEVDFILDECNRTLSRPMNHSHVRAAWAGLRPLVRAPGSDPNDTKKLARDHVVDIVQGGLVSICGGKWTTYRKMAEDAVDKAVSINPELSHATPCATHDLKLVGADRGGLVCNQAFDKVVVTLREQYDMDKAVAKHLMQNYGTRALLVAKVAEEIASKDSQRTSDHAFRYKKLNSKYPMLEAEVVFACRQEFACTAVDVLARRTRLAFLDSKAAETALPRVLDMMQTELKWSGKRKEQERKDALKFLESMSMPLQ